MNAVTRIPSASVNRNWAPGVRIDAPVAGNPIVGETKRSVRKNRWAAAVTAAISPDAPSTTVADWSIDILGDKHDEVLAEIHDAIKVPIDDLGVADALDRPGKVGTPGYSPVRSSIQRRLTCWRGCDAEESDIKGRGIMSARSDDATPFHIAWIIRGQRIR